MTSKPALILGLLGFSAYAASCAQDAADSGTSRQASTADQAVAPSVNGATKSMSSAASAARTTSSSASQASGAAGASTAGSGGRAPSTSVAGSVSAGANAAGASAKSTASTAGSSSAAGSAAAAGSQAQHSAAAGVGADAAGMGAAMQAATPANWRIAFLGDSITETTCTTLLVYDALRKAGHSNFDFVGTRQNQQGCGVDDADRDCEGHSGYLVTDIVGSGPKAAELPMWCAADKADLVLMHFGTNDAWNSGIPLENIIKAFSEVIAKLREAQPHVIVLVAQIIPLEPDGCNDCPGRVQMLNAMIPMWAASESTAESPIYVVDQWTGFDAGPDTSDRVHPNMQGSQKMADKWLAALKAHNVF